ncbi:HD-GYP domain-containing protein [Pseudomonas sp. DWP3-1-2]|uniref:HD-GYP domain-containing protein n=1 Tax=Pseudomonas sp. DWP3-1-2 TaxID=2804645 RepID=UPI003CEC9788
MLKHIAVSELRMGMFIHEFCGPGIDQPLWKNGFLLQHEQDLQRIFDAKVAELWINVCRGIDIDTPCPESAESDLPDNLRSLTNRQVASRAALNQEVTRAVQLCTRSKAVMENMFNDLRMGRIAEMEQVTELVTEISASLMRHPDALISLVRLKTSDEYTYMHSVAVCALMIALARQLKLPASLVHEAGVAGLMHDVGKAAVPVAILNKPGTLSETEFETMRGHPEAGSKMLVSSRHFTPRVLDVCLHHHEKVDGTGYPHKLMGSQISLFARMGAVCDVYDAVTSDRPYKSAWGPADAIHRMAEWRGHFDEKIFQAFVKCIGIYPVGALVRLRSGRIGVVTEQHEHSLLTPKVMVFYSVTAHNSIEPTVVNLATQVDEDRIVSRECAENLGFKNVDELWSGLAAGHKSLFA